MRSEFPLPSSCCSSMNCCSSTNDVIILRHIIFESQEPARRRPVKCREAEARIQSADHVVLGGSDVVRDKCFCATPSRRLNRDVHRLELELPAEHAAAHYPIFDLKHAFVVVGRAKNHRADETVVADSIQKSELHGQSARQIDEICYFLRGVSPSCRVELIGLVDQLDNAGVVDARE